MLEQEKSTQWIALLMGTKNEVKDF
jgi:hypothetical protein